MKKFYSAILLLILTWTSLNAQTYISNKQEVYGTWRKSNSPYIINGEAIVPKGESLTIEAGVTVKFKTGSSSDYSKSSFDKGMLRVKGSISAEGTANNLITFTRNGSDGNWGAIIIDNAESTCEFKYCLITYGENVYSAVSNSSVASYGCFSVHFSTCNLNNCIFYKNSFWSLFPANATVNVTNCTFVQNTSYDIYNHVSDIIVKNTILDDISNSSGTCEMYNCCVKTDCSNKGYKTSNNIYGKSPELVDPASYNFALKSYSPCKGAGQYGTDIGAITSSSGSSYSSSSYSSGSSKSISDNQEVYGTWTKSNSPYVIKGKAIVPSYKTLTIEKGVVVKFEADGALEIKGTIKAIGEANDLIVFTKNGSENWKEIQFVDSDNDNVFKFCKVEYGDYYNEGYGAITLKRSKLDISNCIIVNNGGVGIHYIGCTSQEINNCTFANNENTDVYSSDNGQPYVTNCIFWNSIRPFDNYGVSFKYCSFNIASFKEKPKNLGHNLFNSNPRFVNDKSDFHLTSSSPCIGAGEYGVDMGALPYKTQSSYSSNSYSSSSSGPTTISDRQEVYGTWTKSGSPYIVKGEAIVPEGKTLTIEPGVTVKLATGRFAADYRVDNIGMILVKGKLDAQGTYDERITFTRDGSSGNWGVIIFSNSSNNKMIYCNVEYPGVVSDIFGITYTRGVTFVSSSGLLKYTLIANSNDVTFQMNSSSPEIINCTFVNGSNTCIHPNAGTCNPKIKNTIVWQEGSLISGSAQISHSLFKTSISGQTDLGGNIIGRDPGFVSYSGNDFRLTSSSPCIGAGENGEDIGAFPRSNPGGSVAQSSPKSYTSGPTKISDQQEVYGTWSKAGSPYIIEGEAIVPAGKTLTIEPGVTVKLATGTFAADYRKDNIGMINVKGKLDAQGTYDQRITFTRNGSDGNWGVIIFSNSTGNKLVCCSIEYPGVVSDIYGLTYTRGVTFVNSSGLVKYTLIANSNDVTFQMNASSPEIINCTFVNGDNTCIHPNSGTCNPKIKNTIVWQEGSLISGDAQISHSLFKTSISGQTDLGGNIIGRDPGFVNYSGNDFRLKSGSPCIGAGENGEDIGAFPYKNPPALANNNVAQPKQNNNNVSNNNNVNNNNNNVSNNNNNNNSNVNKQEGNFSSNLPPILSIQDIALSKNYLYAGESVTLSITLKNIGAGDANGVYVNLTSDLAGLQFPSKTNFPVIAKSGGTQTINIDIKGSLEIATAEAVLKIEIVEPNFKVKIQGKQAKFPTREFLKPEMLIAKFAVVENLSANPNNQIDINEQIDVKFAIQNVGQGNAEDVSINITNNQTGVMLLGVVDNLGNLVRKNPTFATIPVGKYETITYRYFVNSEFTSNQLTFSINTTEKYGKYSLNQTKSVEINKVLQEEGYIRTVAQNEEKPVSGKVVIEDIPDFVADIDQNIPTNPTPSDKTFAVVIGNESYTKEIKVKYALNDARIFKQYLQKTLGLPVNNIHYIENATYGQILDGLKWINDVIKAYNGQAKVIFYYAGHGMPDEATKSAFLLPVDGNSQNTASAVKLGDVYAKLTEFPSQSITVFLDACFSGSTRETNESMLAQGRGVKIKPKDELLTGNMVVLSAATGDETAFPYTEKQHGMFTYFLLKKLQETKGNATLDELSKFVITNVTQQSVVVNKKSQTPQVNTSSQMQNTWQTLKLK